MLSFVVAMSENHVIGKDGALPWHLPEDLKKFKEITISGSKTMIMGRKTFESLPRILPGRKHLIFTRDENYKVDDANVEVIHHLEALKPYTDSKEEYFVIGGGEIFSMLFPYTQRMYLTIIHHHFEGDTYMPQYEENHWKAIESYEGKVDENNKYKHTYLTLEKL